MASAGRFDLLEEHAVLHHVEHGLLVDEDRSRRRVTTSVSTRRAGVSIKVFDKPFFTTKVTETLLKGLSF